MRRSLPRRTYFTNTSLGRVPHASVVCAFGGLMLPVALVRDVSGALCRDVAGLPVPRKVGSRFVYALPGGGEVLR